MAATILLFCLSVLSGFVTASLVADVGEVYHPNWQTGSLLPHNDQNNSNFKTYYDSSACTTINLPEPFEMMKSNNNPARIIAMIILHDWLQNINARDPVPNLPRPAFRG